MHESQPLGNPQKGMSALFSAGAKEAITELVRTLLPALARKVIAEEIQRIREEERAMLPQGEELASLIRDAFTPRVESVAREVVKEMVRVALPEVAERLVREEIARIRTNH